MYPSLKILQEYAKLAVVNGVNVQKDQILIIRTTTNCALMAQLVTKEAYKVGASEVVVFWTDPIVSNQALLYASLESLTEVPEHEIQKHQYYLDKGACALSIISPIPGLNDLVDPARINQNSLAVGKKLGFFSQYTGSNKTQWSIIAIPNPTWATKVFPNDKESVAVHKLWSSILQASRVQLNKSIKNWDEHNKKLGQRCKTLNDLNFKTLHFTNSLGTDLVIDLPEGHIWSGGSEITPKKVIFNPNIPTEEVFSMPHKEKINGTVVSTMPLNYKDTLINDIKFIFKDGKIIEAHSSSAESTLIDLINTDEGASSLGEVALISYDSPIRNTGILFYNTLFDENASCHLALGRAYPMNIKDGVNKTVEELKPLGYNYSLIHIDFMFGSFDMKVVGTKYDGTKVVVMQDGSLVI